MRIPTKQLKDAVLGKTYDLSVAFLSETQMRKAMHYRYGAAAKNKKIANVLSFPLSKTSGEILICKKAAPPFTPAYLLIHGLLHLKGRPHGVTMEREERRLLKEFGLRAHE